MATPLRVLIVEDNEDDAALVLHELRRGGYEPVWKRVDTREALVLVLKQELWDIVISDYSMPGFGAPEALRTVKDHGAALPFIIMSGTVGEETAVDSMRAGAQDFILKDRPARLCPAVARELREAELRRAHATSQELLSETRQRLDSATQQLLQAEKLTALGELVAGVAHEMNNPLSSIMGYSELLLGTDLPPDVRKRLLIMHSEAERMRKIVKNLLTFARKHPPEKQYLSLNEVVARTLELKTYDFSVCSIRVIEELDATLPKTMLDFHQMQQIVLNLLNNAEHSMVEAGRAGAIHVRSSVVNGRIELRVTDDGPGVPVEFQPRIFEPFFTTKKDGRGTGLGLSLCYGIAQEHGGLIRLESQCGQGATFVVELPLHPEIETRRGTPYREMSRAGQPLRILVIDDESAVQELLAEILRSLGHDVDTASDASEALEKIRSDKHDLFISDMRMPDGSGRDIYQAILDKSPALARRIVFTTGDGASLETRRFLEETGNEVVLKPFTIEEIEQAVANAVVN